MCGACKLSAAQTAKCLKTDKVSDRGVLHAAVMRTDACSRLSEKGVTSHALLVQMDTSCSNCTLGCKKMKLCLRQRCQL